jgi:hypothetical protein
MARPFLPDRDVTDGELADVPGRRLRGLWTAGRGKSPRIIRPGWPKWSWRWPEGPVRYELSVDRRRRTPGRPA